MRVLLRVLAPLLSLAVAALGVLLVVEVVAAWITPGSTGLLLPWASWRTVLENTQWTATPVLWVAIGVGVVGLILVLVGLLARRHDIELSSPSEGITVTTAPRVLARLVGRRVRSDDQVAGATVTASAKKVAVRAQGRGTGGGTAGTSEVRSAVRTRVDEVLGELPLARTPRVSVSVSPRPEGTPVTTATSSDPVPQTARGAGKTSRRAVARSAGGSRSGITLLGLVLLAAGVLTVLLSVGVFGTNRPQRPLLDPVVTEFLGANALVARIVAIVVGVLLVILGLIWAGKALSPERRPDLVLDGGPNTDIRVSSSAAADAVADGAADLPGVARARARMVGSATAPAVRATVWVVDGADVADICRRLDSEVLAQVRGALGLASLPVAVRLELDTSASDKQSRVS